MIQMKRDFFVLIAMVFALSISTCSDGGIVNYDVPEGSYISAGEHLENVDGIQQNAKTYSECEPDPQLLRQLGLENAEVLSYARAHIRDNGEDDLVFFICSNSVPVKAEPATLYEMRDGLYYEAGEESLYDNASYNSETTMQEYLLFTNTGTFPVLKNVTPYNQTERKADVNVYANDLDGDGLDEIIIREAIDGVAGYRQYYAMIYDCDEGIIDRVFKTDPEFMWNRDLVMQLRPNGTLLFKILGCDYEIKLRVTEMWNDLYKETWGINYVDAVADKYYDRITVLDDEEYYHLWVASCWSFDIKDVDNDGIFEVECKRYCYLLSQLDYVGSLCSILKYDPKTGKYDFSEGRFEYKDYNLEPQKNTGYKIKAIENNLLLCDNVKVKHRR